MSDILGQRGKSISDKSRWRGLMDWFMGDIDPRESCL